MTLPRLRAGIRQVVLPALVLFLLDLLAAATLYGSAQGYWLFKNTTNSVQMAAVLTFSEAVVCLLIAGLSGAGIGEHATIVREAASGARFDMDEYQTTREKSFGFAFQLAAIGIVLILLTLLLTLAA